MFFCSKYIYFRDSHRLNASSTIINQSALQPTLRKLNHRIVFTPISNNYQPRKYVFFARNFFTVWINTSLFFRFNINVVYFPTKYFVFIKSFLLALYDMQNQYLTKLPKPEILHDNLSVDKLAVYKLINNLCNDISSL